MKKAFTLLELVFVIVIIGILSAILAPSVKRDTLQEAADQIASHIRLTQRLALHENKYDPTNQYWYRGRWQIYFSNFDGDWTYSVFADGSGYSGNPDLSEMAHNPLNDKQYLSGGFSGTLPKNDSRVTKSMNLTKKYGINSITFTGGCSFHNSKRLSFDYLGRPLKGNLKSISTKYNNRLVQTDCNITISNGSESKSIIVYPETGYVKVN